MPAFIDLTGQKFGRLLVIKRAPSRGKTAFWRCQCDCGRVAETAGVRLRNGQTTSCGCFKSEGVLKRFVTHGAARGGHKTGEYNIWVLAKSRCANPRDKRYADYGGRGIEMCREWRESFAAFLRDMGPRPDGHSLDRIDVNGNYEPSNCRWATAKQQARNRRQNTWVLWEGERFIIKDLAAKLGLSGRSRHFRDLIISRGMSPERALAHCLANPPLKRNRIYRRGQS